MRQRHGFTLVEVMIALVIMGVVTGAIYNVLTTSQRLSLAQAEQVSLQSNVRTGSLVVPNELRELNTVFGGMTDQNDILPPLDDDAITYQAMRGLGFLCQDPAVNATELRIAQATWTGLRAPNAARDDLYLFIDDNPDDAGDDRWEKLAVTNVEISATACGVGELGYILTVAPIPGDVGLNTPVRLFEVMEMKLHEADGAWWLAARSVSAGEIDVQPVLGPLTEDGFQLEYLDGNGVETANEKAVKSIRVTVRGLTEGAVRIGGSGVMGHPEEALVSQVLLRNSIRP